MKPKGSEDKRQADKKSNTHSHTRGKGQGARGKEDEGDKGDEGGKKNKGGKGGKEDKGQGGQGQVKITLGCALSSRVQSAELALLSKALDRLDELVQLIFLQ
jgi:hypothetical protein